MVAARLGVALACVVAIGVAGDAGAAAQQGARDWTPLLKNRGLVDSQMKCLQGSGPCDRIGDHIKSTMKAAVCAVALLCAVAVLAPVTAQDFTAFLQNRAFVRRQLACVANTGPCDGIGRFLTRAAAEVLSRNCANCTPEQQANANRLLNFIRSNYPAEYGQIYNRFRG